MVLEPLFLPFVVVTTATINHTLYMLLLEKYNTIIQYF